MATTSPARIDDELYASAKLAGSVQSRSASQQVAHWARIGREIEASSSISAKEIAAVLAGSRSYDGLDPKEQAVVRAEWSVRMEEARAALDLAEDFAGAGRTWVELDDKGRVVERGGRAETRAAKKAAARKPGTRKPVAEKAAATRGPAAAKNAAAKKKAAAKRTAAKKAAAAKARARKPRVRAAS
jgi:hypothetical protein